MRLAPSAAALAAFGRRKYELDKASGLKVVYPTRTFRVAR